MSNKSICAVIVTYNRKELLLNCLQAVKSQKVLPNHILVINNASTDGTIDFLKENGWQNNEFFTLINLPTNQGGAGGFYQGILTAYEKGHDYIWLMDDDGYPDENCLQNLMPYLSENCYIGPIVLDAKDKQSLSFAMRLPNQLKIIDQYQQFSEQDFNKNILEKIILPFNGTLISRKLIEKIGFPYKEYFIWGDEKEYTLRAEKENAQIFTVLNAIFYHPVQSSISTPMFFGKLRFNYSPSKLKLYCFCRNSIAIYIKHKGYLYAFAFFLKATWFFLFTKKNLKELFFSWKAMWHALTNNFSEHLKLLQ